MARSTMAALILRVRQLINDPAGTSPTFSDDDIQAVLDESRWDVYNGALRYEPTFIGGTIAFLDYFSQTGSWEDGMVLKQYLTVTVTPSAIEPIPGHFQFAASTLPPVFITGKNYDIYRAAADLLERMASQWMLRYDIAVDGQSLHRSQAATMLDKRIVSLRRKQRPGTIIARRTDLNSGQDLVTARLGATPLDYFASGNGS